jgi:RNA polymerase sigma factor (sigma-70 family)
VAFIRNIKHDSASDAELVESYRNTGNTSVLASLYGRYMELVYGVCLKYLTDAGHAKDAVMEIYGELNAKLTRHEVSNFRSWLYSVARNHCLMKLRSAKSHSTIYIDEERMQFAEEMHHEEVKEKEEQFVILSDCMQSLPAEQKNVIRLFYLEGNCYNQIVEITGFEWNKVRSLVQNGRRNLKVCMEKTRNRIERTG